MSQNLAETVVVNDTQSLTNVKGVDPVTSSHCALELPPRNMMSVNNTHNFLTENLQVRKYLILLTTKNIQTYIFNHKDYSECPREKTRNKL